MAVIRRPKNSFSFIITNNLVILRAKVIKIPQTTKYFPQKQQKGALCDIFHRDVADLSQIPRLCRHKLTQKATKILSVVFSFVFPTNADARRHDRKK